MIHLFYLHLKGSNNPLALARGYRDVVLFHRYYRFKDGLAIVVLMCGLFLRFLIFPDGVLDIESYIEADPLVTPSTIKPEWYFLVYYSMLRSVDSKVGGLVLVLTFLFLLWLPTVKKPCVYRVVRQLLF